MQTISTDELRQKKERQEEFLLVNTLSKDDFPKTRIPDAINIPQDQPDFAAKVENAAGSKSMPVVVYCASTKCDSSTSAAKKLDAAGFTNVFDYEGGAASWHQGH